MTRCRETVMLVGAIAWLAGITTAGGQVAPACRLPEPGQQLLQGALDGWAWVRREVPKLNRAPLPWVVLVDERCSWHLSPDASFDPMSARVEPGWSYDGQSLAVLSAPHGGSPRLPNGTTVGPRAAASTSVYGNGSRTFSLISEFGVWRRDPRHAGNPRLEQFFQGLVLHELTHTVHLARVQQRLSTLRHTLGLPPSVDDDIVQKQFGTVPAFRDRVDREVTALYEAVRSADPRRQRQLAATAVAMVQERRQRFFAGDRAGYAELEDLFFAMEGIGQLAVYRWGRSRPGADSDAAMIEFVRANRQYWSQDEGLALMLLIDALVPDWQAVMLAEDIHSPVTVLERALAPK